MLEASSATRLPACDVAKSFYPVREILHETGAIFDLLPSVQPVPVTDVIAMGFKGTGVYRLRRPASAVRHKS